MKPSWVLQVTKMPDWLAPRILSWSIQPQPTHSRGRKLPWAFSLKTKQILDTHALPQPRLLELRGFPCSRRLGILSKVPRTCMGADWSVGAGHTSGQQPPGMHLREPRRGGLWTHLQARGRRVWPPIHSHPPALQQPASQPLVLPAVLGLPNKQNFFIVKSEKLFGTLELLE